MLEKLKDAPPRIEAIKAVGKIPKEDYEKIFEPIFDEARQQGRRIRLLYQFGPEFQGFTPGTAWEDVKIGTRSLWLFDGCAIVTGIGWIRESTRLVGFLMPWPVRVFGNHELDKAIEWLSSLPDGAGVSHRLVPESEVIVIVIVVEVTSSRVPSLGQQVLPAGVQRSQRPARLPWREGTHPMTTRKRDDGPAAVALTKLAVLPTSEYGLANIRQLS